MMTLGVVDYHRSQTMYTVNGEIPAEQLRASVQRLRRDPPHPGSFIQDFCLDGNMVAGKAARLLGVDEAEFGQVLSGCRGISIDLAQRMERAGWSTADLWMSLQTDYDLSQARRNLDRAESEPAEMTVQAAPPETLEDVPLK